MHVMKMCQAFVQEGSAVKLIGRKPPGDSRLDGSFWQHYGIHDQFPLKRLPAYKLLRDYDYDLRATSTVLRTRPKVVYARNLRAAAATSLLGYPLIFEAHAPPQTKSEHWFLRRVLSGKGFRLMVVISNRLKELMLEQTDGLVQPERITVLPDGVDFERFNDLPSSADARNWLGHPPERFTAGYVGHLYPGRGIELIVELARRHPVIRFEVVGGDAISVANRRNRHADLDNIEFRGFVENSEIPIRLAACDVLLMPFQKQVSTTALGTGNTAEWMSPMKMFEYLASGRPILSSDLSVLREVLTENNSFLLPPADVGAWSTTLTELEKKPTSGLARSSQARLDVQRYTWRGRARSVCQALKELGPSTH